MRRSIRKRQQRTPQLIVGIQQCIIAHHTHKENMTNIEECNIDATLGNGQKMKCKLTGTVNMKLQGGEIVNPNGVLYVPQLVNNIMSI